MKKFKYFSKNDPNKETIGIVNASDMDEAILFLSRIKRLTPPQINILYIIEEYGN